MQIFIHYCIEFDSYFIRSNEVFMYVLPVEGPLVQEWLLLACVGFHANFALLFPPTAGLYPLHT